MANRLISPFTFILLIVFFCVGCVHEKPVTKEEAIEFAKKLEASMSKRNPAIFNDIFDAETLKERIKKEGKSHLSSSTIREIPEALKKKRLGDEILQSIGKTGMYRFIKHYEKDGKQRLIFRLYGDDGLNYHDIELIRAGKEIKAADIYIYLSGENLSKSFADILLQVEDYYKTDAQAQDLLKSATNIKKFIRQKDYDKALEEFNSLPDTLKTQKHFQFLHVQIASNFGDEKYKEALDEYKRLFPNEPGMHLLLLDMHFLNKEYEEALDDINKVDKAINSDPFLDYYRGLLYKLMDKDSAAQLCLERLYKNEPNFGSGLIELIALYARTGNVEKAEEVANAYRKNKKFDQETLDMMYNLYPNLKK